MQEMYGDCKPGDYDLRTLRVRENGCGDSVGADYKREDYESRNCESGKYECLPATATLPRGGPGERIERTPPMPELEV